MIELQNDCLEISFPEVHKNAHMSIEFQRTLRIADDGKTHYLPPGFGRFPLKHVDDFTSKVPQSWEEHGGLFFPMYQSEAMWINFSGGGYPFAVKIAAGKVNALTGGAWSNELSVSTAGNETIQDYLVVPDQPWLDGFAVEKGMIRQFVAMPLGKGFTAEEQLTGEAQHGGIQIICYPLKRKYFKPDLDIREPEDGIMMDACMEMDMGLGLGGKMEQEIFRDEYGIEKWDTTNSSRCFIHIANSKQYHSITNSHPPTQPPTVEQYNQAGLPWYDYYDETQTAQPGSAVLGGIQSIEQMEGSNADNGKSSPEPIVITPDIKKKVRTGNF